MKLGNTIRNMSGVARAMTSRLYQAPPDTISSINSDAWPSPEQPVKPVAPEGSGPLAWPFLYGQNLIYTPRADAVYAAADLRALSIYPLARVCIDNAKDMICKLEWNVALKQQPGESRGDVMSRRRKSEKGDEGIGFMTQFLERPNREQDWSEFMRGLLEDMLVIDAASILLLRNRGGQIIEIRGIPGDSITRYIDENGFTPVPDNPAYAQLWQGLPRVDLTTDQLVYKPRNIVPRGNSSSSYLYGMSPCEGIADEIKIGMARLAYVFAFYDKGSLANMIHVVPSTVTNDRLKEAMQWVNAELSGNLDRRRQYRIIQGFNTEGKADQIIEPKEPVLADVFDDLHIRKICFAFGSSPQRLQKMMNRGSAQSSQSAAMEEGIRPWMDWTKKLMDYLIQVKMEMKDYEFLFASDVDADITKQSKVDQLDVHEGIRTRDEVREQRGLDPLASQNELMGKPTVTTANGVVELGEVITSGGDPGSGGSPKPSSPSKPNGKVNGKVNGDYHLVYRGE